MTTKTPFDVHKDYKVFSKEKDYIGKSAKVEFHQGQGRVWALPKDATQEQKEYRHYQLEWLLGNGYRVEEFNAESPA